MPRLAETYRPALLKRLIVAALADKDLLALNQEVGDNLPVPRKVEFFLYARSVKRANLVATFINDLGYGHAEAMRVEDRHRVRVLIIMPVTQPILCSVSGFFACLSAIYDLEYDGWESAIQRGTEKRKSPRKARGR